MGKGNKGQKPVEQIPSQQPKLPEPTAEQKMKASLLSVNEIVYDGLKEGKIKITDPDEVAKKLTQGSLELLIGEICKGQVEINEEKVPFQLQKKSFRHLNMNMLLEPQQKQYQTQNNHRLSKSNLNSLQSNLKDLQQHAAYERNIDRQQSQYLRRNAKSFVLKMHREKQQFQEKIKSRKSESRLFSRAYSEDTIVQMKQKLKRKAEQKRVELEQRVVKIQKRKLQRAQREANNQIEHWEKIKAYESSKSARVLPLIGRYHKANNPQRVDNFYVTPIHENHKSKKELASKPSLKLNSLELLDRKMLNAKLKLENFQNQYNNAEMSSIERMNKMLEKNSKGVYHLEDSNSNSLSYSENTVNIKNDPLSLKYSEDRFKILGNQYLRKSLEDNTSRVKLNKSKLSPVMGNPEFPQIDLTVNASNIHPSQNLHLSSLEESWSLALKKLQFHEIDKVKGLDILSSIEKKLDRLDRKGVTDRLRKKVEVVDLIENNRRNALVTEATSQRLSFEKENLSDSKKSGSGGSNRFHSAESNQHSEHDIKPILTLQQDADNEFINQNPSPLEMK